MLLVGRQRRGTSHGSSRRELLQAGALGACGLSLADALRVESRAAEPARARSVILLWLWGGPSHLDLFDLKPHAPVEYRGPYAPIATTAPGIEVSELLPRLARRMDRCTLVRSLHTTSNDHGIAGTIGLTGGSKGAQSLGGQTLPGDVQPSHGSIANRLLAAGGWPPGFVSLGGPLHQGKRAITGEGGGVLGAAYDPFRLDYDVRRGLRAPQLELVDGLTPDGLGARQRLLDAFDQGADALGRHLVATDRARQYEQAFALLTSPQARAAFDVGAEPETSRMRYGRFRFGQCCLMARRLIEAGTRFVQVNWSSHVEPYEDTGDGGWDMHDRNFPQLQDRHAWMLDQSLAALLDDLDERGLAEETIVVAVGEFGRTPRINNKAGRDHWEHCYAALVAGGGARRGQVIGASDKLGEYPTRQPMTPGDLFTTVLAQLGITTPRLTELNLAPAGEVVEGVFG